MFKWLRELTDALERGRRFVTHDVWHIGMPGEEIPHGFIIKNIRVIILLAKGLFRDHLFLRASALTFATMLAIVPFLAIMFFIIQTFNVGEAIADVLAPVNGQKTEVADRSEAERRNEELWENFQAILFWGFEKEDLGEAQGAGTDAEGSVENPLRALIRYAERSSDPKTITFAGVIFVFSAVFGLMMNIESSFNTIWGIRRNRPWHRMLSNYLAILLLLPFVVGGMISLTAVLQVPALTARLGSVSLGLLAAQYLLSWLAFTALYFLVPNTRVRFRYASLAGIISGTLWCLLSLAYVRFQFGLDRYSLLYSTFAQIPVLLMWVYFSWLIVLLGAELAFAYQNEKTFAMERLSEGSSYAYKESLGLWAMIQLGRRFDEGLRPLSAAEAAEAWNVPTRLLNDVLGELEEGGLVTASGTTPPTYLPGRSIQRITVKDVFNCLRESGRDPSALRQTRVLRGILQQLDDPKGDLASRTIHDLVQAALALEGPANRPAPVVQGVFGAGSTEGSSEASDR